jgi:alkylation response protein AidB-like acyl-CoA dehydrogenase
MPARPGLDDARLLLTAADSLIAKALARAREITAHGNEIDAHQVLAERVAYAATESRAARAFVDFATDAGRDGRGSERLETLCAASVAQLVRSLRERIDGVLLELGLDETALEEAFTARVRDGLRRTGSESVLREIGRQVAAARGRDRLPLDELSEQVREAVREFADREVAPEAERIHRRDALVPESFITKIAELGYFGLAVP